jgi:hypothetical protein
MTHRFPENNKGPTPMTTQQQLEKLKAEHPDLVAKFEREFANRQTEKKFAAEFGETYRGQATPSVVTSDEYVLSRFVDAGLLKLDHVQMASTRKMTPTR